MGITDYMVSWQGNIMIKDTDDTVSFFDLGFDSRFILIKEKQSTQKSTSFFW